MANVRRRLRIAHVTLGLEVGGQEKLLVEFARHADRDRFDLHFVSLSGRGQLAETLAACGGTVSALHEPEGLRPGLIFRLARCLRGFDIVHTHDDKPLLYGVPAARLAGARAVIHTHHHGPLPSIQRRHTLAMACLAHWTDRFVCVSRHSARWLIGEGVPARKVVILANGIDMLRFAWSGPNPDGPIVTVARLSPEKDQETLLRAMALVRREVPQARLEIAGAGPCRPALEKLAGALHLRDTVRFLGHVSDVPDLLARARVFVLSSLTEGISLTLLEAMASGLPVVATRVGGNPEVVSDGETGLLVPPRQPAALAGALVRLLRDPDAGKDFARAGRQRAEAQFDVRRMVAQYEALYQGRFIDSEKTKVPWDASKTPLGGFA